MARGAWDRTSLIASIIAESNRDPKINPVPYGPSYFNRFRRKECNVEDDGRLAYNPAVLQAIQDKHR